MAPAGWPGLRRACCAPIRCSPLPPARAVVLHPVRPALLFVVALLVAACGNASADDDTVLSALCDAITAEDVATAAEVFESDAHPRLHELAAAVQAQDRGVAARLLEAKYAVETVVRGDELGPAPLVRERLEVLAERSREALQALDRPAPAC